MVRGTRICPTCEGTFTIPTGRGYGHMRYCSGTCRAASRGMERRRSAEEREDRCAWCEVSFVVGPGRGRARRYCGDQCKNAAAAHRRSSAPRPTCAVEGCSKRARSQSSQHCEMHYARIRRYGDLHPSGCPRCGAASALARNGAFCSRECRLLVEKYKRYDLTIEEGVAIEAASGGRCAICGDDNRGSALSWDHCHETGRLRGLLCNLCNAGIGMLRDSPQIMRAAIEYLS